MVVRFCYLLAIKRNYEKNRRKKSVRVMAYQLKEGALGSAPPPYYPRDRGSHTMVRGRISDVTFPSESVPYLRQFKTIVHILALFYKPSNIST